MVPIPKYPLHPTHVRTGYELGPYLRETRKAYGWSQQELGARVGLSQERISAIERAPHRVAFDQLLDVAMALGLEFVVQPRGTEPPLDGW